MNFRCAPGLRLLQWYRQRTTLVGIFGEMLTLRKWSGRVLKDVLHAMSVSIHATLRTRLNTIGTVPSVRIHKQWLFLWRGRRGCKLRGFIKR